MEKDLSKQAEEIGARIAADNFEHCTADPIFVVEQKIRDYGYDPDYTEESEWVDDETSELCGEEKSKRLSALDNAGRPVSDKYRRVFYKERWEFVTACFTREGAEAFIRRQKHNLKEVRIYVNSLFRNQEMIDVREFLKQCANKTTIA